MGIRATKDEVWVFFALWASVSAALVHWIDFLHNNKGSEQKKESEGFEGNASGFYKETLVNN